MKVFNLKKSMNLTKRNNLKKEKIICWYLGAAVKLLIVPIISLIIFQKTFFSLNNIKLLPKKTDILSSLKLKFKSHTLISSISIARDLLRHGINLKPISVSLKYHFLLLFESDSGSETYNLKNRRKR